MTSLRCVLTVSCLLVFIFLTTAVPIAFAEKVTYRVHVENLWLEETHGPLPAGAGFGEFVGAVHNDQASFWGVGELASPGLVSLAETGATTVFMDEVSAQIGGGEVLSGVKQFQRYSYTDDSYSNRDVVFSFLPYFTPDFRLQVDSEFLLATVVASIDPGPDWFVGVEGVSLRANDQWVSELIVDLFPYDAGTRTASDFSELGVMNMPPQAVSLITEQSGQLITPQLLGRLTFERLQLVGDFDNDGDVDFNDVDFYSGNIGVAAVGELEMLDLDSDGVVTLVDHDFHIAKFLETIVGVGAFLGDLNLDGDVDVSQLGGLFPGGFADPPPYQIGDAGNLLQGLGTDAGAGYGSGDLNADGDVDVSEILVSDDGVINVGDAVRLLANLGQTQVPPSGVSGVTESVPEPAGIMLLAMTGLAMMARRMC